MDSWATLITLIVGGLAALNLALRRARNTGTKEGAQQAQRTLTENDARHAQEIADAVAKARADRRTPSPDAGGLPVDGPFIDRGWRD